MSIRQLAAQDLAGFMSNTREFAWPIVITSPAGVVYPTTGFSTDISQVIDPETGEIVSGRNASVAVPLSLFLGQDQPRAEQSQTARPWVVEFADILGSSHKFRVIRSDPDRALGCLVLMLGGYQ